MLKDGALRSSDLQHKMPGISNKMFTQTARELEKNGIVEREVFPVVPPKVEYRLTKLGKSILPIIFQMCDWGTNLLETEKRTLQPESNILSEA
ncbi:MAG: winged helix-turn-helix transcriptional regulator [Bacteroides sp.]|nr:winged helix-turn-helix transcriptional regulator [Bacteroides sp.]